MYQLATDLNREIKAAFAEDVTPAVRQRTLANLAYISSMTALKASGFPSDDPRILKARNQYSQGEISQANDTLDDCFSTDMLGLPGFQPSVPWQGFKPLASMGIYDPLEHSSKQGGCIGEAFDLLRENDNEGAVFYVMDIKGKPVGHAYFIEDTSKPKGIAKNQADNGFEGYPKLTVDEVMQYGIRLKDESAKELTAILMARSTTN